MSQRSSYFTYSLKYSNGDAASLLSTVLPPINEKKKRKTRACDGCAVRKTKCDDSRPCRHCVNNNLNCTERRERKKSGPKNLRKKTIDSIQSISKDSNSHSPEHDEAMRSSESSILQSIDFVEVAEYLRTIPPEIMEIVSAFTASSVSSTIIENVTELGRAPTPTANLSALSKRLATLSYVSLIFAALKAESSLDSADMQPSYEQHLKPQLQNYISLLYSDCARYLFLPNGNTADFEANYNLSLANLHMYALIKVGGTSHSLELVYIRSAISHLQILEAHYGKPDIYTIDLRRLLYVWERHSLLFSPEPAFRHSALLVNLSEMERGPLPQSVVYAYYLMLNVLDEQLLFQQVVAEPFSWRFLGSATPMGLSYASTKAKLNELLQNYGTGGHTYSTLSQFLYFMLSLKVIQVYLKELSQEYVALELFEAICQVNVIVNLQRHYLHNFIVVLGVVPQMLEALKAYLQVTVREQWNTHTYESLLQLSHCISYFLGQKSEFNDPILHNWFSQLNDPQQQEFIGGL